MSAGRSTSDRVAERSAVSRVGPLGTLRAAVAVLTRIPVSDRLERSIAGETAGAAAFGLVGAVGGAAAAVPILLVGERLPTLAAIASIAILVVLTGALHLDGLSDTADALLARDPEAAERARRDPSAGPGGVVAIVLVSAAEVAALVATVNDAGPAVAAAGLVTAGAVSRGLAVVVARARRGATVPGGLAAWFAERVGVGDVLAVSITAVAVAIGLAVLVGSPVIMAAAGVGTLVGFGAGLAIVALRGRLDGDGLGATIELAELAVLVAAALASSVASASTGLG